MADEELPMEMYVNHLILFFLKSDFGNMLELIQEDLMSQDHLQGKYKE